MTKFDPTKVLRQVANSRDRITARRRINMARINFKDREAQRYLDWAEKLLRLRR